MIGTCVSLSLSCKGSEVKGSEGKGYEGKGSEGKGSEGKGMIAVGGCAFSVSFDSGPPKFPKHVL